MHLTISRLLKQILRNVKPEILTDAMNRIADCYYIATNYAPAIDYYDKVIDYGKADADYAMFQKGFCLGLMNDNKGKINILTSLTVEISVFILCSECNF